MMLSSGSEGFEGTEELMTAPLPVVSKTTAATDPRLGWPLCLTFAKTSSRVTRSSSRFSSRKRDPS